MTQTIAEYFIQEGEERGEKRGEERGKQRGEIKAKRESILQIMQIRFHSIPPATERKIKSSRRQDRLNAILEKAVVAESISDIGID